MLPTLLATPVGRLIRIVVGLALLVAGAVALPAWVALIGALLVILGGVNRCLLGAVCPAPRPPRPPRNAP